MMTFYRKHVFVSAFLLFSTSCPVSASGKLKNIYVYPIKSCGAFDVQKSWPLTSNGLKYDREWMIVSEDNVVLTQKQLPRMCLIIPNIDTKRGILFLNFLGSEGKKITLYYFVSSDVSWNLTVIVLFQLILASIYHWKMKNLHL
jgi:hypothetical protein